MCKRYYRQEVLQARGTTGKRYYSSPAVHRVSANQLYILNMAATLILEVHNSTCDHKHCTYTHSLLSLEQRLLMRLQRLLMRLNEPYYRSYALRRYNVVFITTGKWSLHYWRQWPFPFLPNYNIQNLPIEGVKKETMSSYFVLCCLVLMFLLMPPVNSL